jgi:hypothetical protein
LCTNWLLAHQLAAERHFDLDRRHPSQISDPIASASPPQRHGLNGTPQRHSLTMSSRNAGTAAQRDQE